MGLFEKKTYTCEKCGQQFVKRVNLNGNLCDECWMKEEDEKDELEYQVVGYSVYYEELVSKSFTLEQLKHLVAHRNGLLQKFKNNDGITREHLTNLSDNYMRLTDGQAVEVIRRLSNTAVTATMGAVYGDKFFCPTEYSGMIVDAQDVFAVGYTVDHKVDAGKREVLLCAVFTNDPYVPVFPMVFAGKPTLLKTSKSQELRSQVELLFASRCPNLQYPISDIKDLKKQISQEGRVRGNLNVQFVMDQIFHASVSSRIFDTRSMAMELSSASADMLDQIGYIQQHEIDRILKMDKKENRNYWNMQAQRISANIKM